MANTPWGAPAEAAGWDQGTPGGRGTAQPAASSHGQDPCEGEGVGRGWWGEGERVGEGRGWGEGEEGERRWRGWGGMDTHTHSRTHTHTHTHTLTHTQISLKPRSGILGQLVVFDFGAFQLVRGLCVHVLKEHEASLLQNAGTPRQRKLEKP